MSIYIYIYIEELVASEGLFGSFEGTGRDGLGGDGKEGRGGGRRETHSLYGSKKKPIEKTMKIFYGIFTVLSFPS